MLTKNEVEGFITVLPLLVDLLPGTGFSITDGEKITQIFLHPDFSLDFFKVGMRVDTWGVANKLAAIAQKLN